MADRGGMTFSGEMFGNVKRLPARFDQAVGLVMKAEAPNVQNYARTHAPWTDQTSNARNGLFAKYRSGGGRNNAGQFLGGGLSSHSIDVYHTMPYGIWLEVRWSGRYRIIVPTITSEGARVMGTLRGLLGKMRR